MSWQRNGETEIIFSGADGAKQYADAWRIAQTTGQEMQLPPRAIGDKRQAFIWSGFMYSYDPMK